MTDPADRFLVALTTLDALQRWQVKIAAGDWRAAAAFLNWRYPDRYPRLEIEGDEVTLDDAMEWLEGDEQSVRLWLSRDPPWSALDRRRG